MILVWVSQRLPYPADPLEHYRAAFGRRTAAPLPQRPAHNSPVGELHGILVNDGGVLLKQNKGCCTVSVPPAVLVPFSRVAGSPSTCLRFSASDLI